jgi:hypothetical protein
MKKRAFQVGELVPGTKLRVVALEESDSHGNQRVRVQCEWLVDGVSCGTEKVMRATALTLSAYRDRNGKLRKPHTSCGCQSKRAHRLYWVNRAEGIRRLVQRNIYRERKYSRKSYEELAAKYGIPVQLARMVYQVYKKRLRARQER